MITGLNDINNIDAGIYSGINIGKYQSWHESLNNGLLAYYPCDDGINLTLRDTFGTKNGTLQDKKLWSTERLYSQNKYVVADGVNEIQFGNHVDYYGIANTDIFTVAAWVYHTTTAVETTIIDMGFRSTASAGSTNNGLTFRITAGKIRFRIRQLVTIGYGGTIRGLWDVRQVLPLRQWVFVVMQRDTRYGYYYSRYANKENYEVMDMGADSPLDTWASLGYRILGNANNNTSNVVSPKESAVCKIGIWNRILKQQEITALYYNGIGMSKTNQFDNGTN
jgi:hypothetical protein